MAEPRYALFADFAGVEDLRAAVERLHLRQELQLEVASAYPLPELDRILGRRAARIPLLAGTLGLLAAVAAWLFQWWSQSAYPWHVGAMSLAQPLPYIPIAFETGILVTALSGVAVLAILLGLPRLDASAAEEASDRWVAGGGCVLIVGSIGEDQREALGRELEAAGAVALRWGELSS
jgi:hypothetical protein